MNLIKDYTHVDKTLIKLLVFNANGTVSVTKADLGSPSDDLNVYAKYLAGTILYAIPYLTASNVTGFLEKGDAGQVLTATQNGYEWKDASNLDTSGSNILTSIKSGLNITTSWTDADDLSTKLSSSTGSYMIQITYGTCIYTGMFTYVLDGDLEDEIILHCGGSTDSSGRGRLFAKIGFGNGKVRLKLAASVSEDNATVTIKYKKLI